MNNAVYQDILHIKHCAEHFKYINLFTLHKSL